LDYIAEKGGAWFHSIKQGEQPSQRVWLRLLLSSCM
jgi:hypothetical protein